MKFTFKNVARSFVTSDGLRLIPSCITPVKLNKEKKKKDCQHLNMNFTYQ
jgi:hypothetical protein